MTTQQKQHRQRKPSDAGDVEAGRRPSLEPPRITLSHQDAPAAAAANPMGSALSLRTYRSRTSSRGTDRPVEFRPFTEASYQRLVRREEDHKRRIEERKTNAGEGKLVGGEIKFDDDPEADEDKIKKDPELADGNILPDRLGEFPEELLAQPIEEIDRHLYNTSFVVINMRFGKRYIYRFTANSAYFCMAAWNPVRKFFISIATNQVFDYFIILTILANCVFLALPFEVKPAEYVFLAIYSFECIVKLMARGLVMDRYTYLRDPWNWLDIFVVITSYVMIIVENTSSGNNVNVGSLRTFRVFRVLKTISIFPGLRIIISALLQSFKMLVEVIVLTFFCMSVFSLFGLDVYMGTFRSKCVRSIDWSGMDPNSNDSNQNAIDAYYNLWIKNSSNWLLDGNGNYYVCGNNTGAGLCSTANVNYTCLPDIGDNPNWGFTNYDHFGWALLQTFQLITLDAWEDQYNIVVRSSGPWNVIFFVVIVFMGSFYLINLMLAVVTLSYQEQAAATGKAEERDKDERRQKKKQQKKLSAPKLEAKKKKKKQKGENDDKKKKKKHGEQKDAEATNTKDAKDSRSKSHKQSDGKADDGDTTTETGSVDTKQLVKPSEPATAKGESDSGMGSQAEVPIKVEFVDVNENGETTTQEVPIDDDDEKKPVVIVDEDGKEYVDRNCPCCGTCCRNYIRWIKFQNNLLVVVLDPVFDLFITFCIVANTVFMASEYYPMSASYSSALDSINMAFTLVFTLEAVLKILSMSKEYFQSGWNIFDMIVVIASIIDLTVQDVDGLSIFRSFRLFRVFRLAQSWVTMRKLLMIIFSAIGAVGNLTLILFIIIFIFAVIGMQLFDNTYTAKVFGSDSKIPRWNFEDFGHSMLMVFRILCGEWIQGLWDCMRANGELCTVVFFPTLILGNFMVLNLFLALLLNSFSNDKLGKDDGDNEASKFTIVIERIKRYCCCCIKKKEGDENATDENTGAKADDKAAGGKSAGADADSALGSDNTPTAGKHAHGDKKHRKKHTGHRHRRKRRRNGDDWQQNHDDVITEQPVDATDDTDGEENEEDKDAILQDCCCPVCRTPCEPGGRCESCACCLCLSETPQGTRWTQFRAGVLKVTSHKAFEGIILFIIFASSVTLCFQDIYLEDQPTLGLVLGYLDTTFTIIFAVEMLLKWVSMGMKKYFTEFWTILDCIIVTISVTDQLLSAFATNVGQISALRVLRALRAFRPLRTISRWEGMKIVVNCLVKAVPSIGNVLLVCMVFWLIFSITGVQFFKGKFYYCQDSQGIQLDYSIIQTKDQCLNQTDAGYLWVNKNVNFDNVFIGYVALFQIATFEGWMELMQSGIDSTAIDFQPKRENAMGYYLFFVIFVIVGAFFTLNLFIGVIIDNFYSIKRKKENALEIFLTPSQKSYYHTMRKLGKKKPQKTVPRPRNTFQDFFFDVATSSKFETTIVLIIFLNMVTMMVDHYKEQPAISQCLNLLNILFTSIFTIEAIIKLIGLRWHYFRFAWNVFDFVIVILSIVGAVLSDSISNAFVQPTLLRVVRIFRIGRVLRLVKAAKGIRQLLFALVISLPALFNIGALLALIVFIYSIVGMSLWGNVVHNGAIDDLVNFETFGRSMVLLFRLITSAGWNDILDGLMVKPPTCNSTHIIRNGVAKESSNGNCSIPELAAIYMVTFVFFTRLIVINLYIAIILENFTQAHEQEEVGVTEDDFEMFYQIWERYDPHASQYIKYEQLSEFVADLEEPLGIPKPNIIALTSFDIAIVEGDKLHCLDVLVALVRNVLGDIEDSDQFRGTMNDIEKKFRDTFPTRVRTAAISTTLRRKKEDIAAKTLQRAWRRHKAQVAFKQVTANAMSLAGRNIANMPGAPGQLDYGSSASLRHSKPKMPAPPNVLTIASYSPA